MYSPHFTISNKVLSNIGVIEGCREVINNAPLVPAWEKKFQEDAVVRQVHHGTHLEGNPLNKEEAAKVMAGGNVLGRPRDVQEIINYRFVLDFIGNFQKERKKEEHNLYTEGLLEKLHFLTTNKILPSEKCGKIRETQVVLKNSQTGEVSFRPPPAIEVSYLIEDLFEWLNGGEAKNIHPIIRSGVVQYEIVRVHPFVDGNGRVARAMATLVLYMEGYDIRRFFSLEEYYDRNTVEYYRALQLVSNSGETGSGSAGQPLNLTPWLEYFTEGLAIELNRIKERIRKLSVDVHMKEKLGGQQLFLTERQIKIIEHIQETGFLQNQSFGSLFPMISEDTILRELKELVDKSIIVKRGKTKGARYVLKT